MRFIKEFILMVLSFGCNIALSQDHDKVCSQSSVVCTCASGQACLVEGSAVGICLKGSVCNIKGSAIAHCKPGSKCYSYDSGTIKCTGANCFSNDSSKMTCKEKGICTSNNSSLFNCENSRCIIHNSSDVTCKDSKYCYVYNAINVDCQRSQCNIVKVKSATCRYGARCTTNAINSIKCLGRGTFCIATAKQIAPPKSKKTPWYIDCYEGAFCSGVNANMHCNQGTRCIGKKNSRLWCDSSQSCTVKDKSSALCRAIIPDDLNSQLSSFAQSRVKITGNPADAVVRGYNTCFGEPRMFPIKTQGCSAQISAERSVPSGWDGIGRKMEDSPAYISICRGRSNCDYYNYCKAIGKKATVRYNLY